MEDFIKKFISLFLLEIYLMLLFNKIKYSLADKIAIIKQFRSFGREYIQQEAGCMLTVTQAYKIFGTPQNIAETYQSYMTEKVAKNYARQNHILKIFIAVIISVLSLILVFVVWNYISNLQYKFEHETVIESTVASEVYY